MANKTIDKNESIPIVVVTGVVICQQCSIPEYSETIHWKNDKQICRQCGYETWKK